VAELIGNTPLVRINSLSDATGCEILGKCEFLNPGGSSKDRVALSIIEDAERRNLIRPHSGCTITEGTVGSTGISLATVARAKGYQCHIVMPDDQAQEKYEILERLGARVEKVRPVSIVDQGHFVRVAKTRAESITQEAMRANESGPMGSLDIPTGAGFFCDQFENLANFEAHLRTTGPEIFSQCNGQLDAFVMGAGTGGTIAGVAHYLKPRMPNLQIVLADPWGSGLFNKVKFGIMYAPTEAEGTRRRHQVDTVVEGIGINRLTENFKQLLGKAHSSEAGLRPVEHYVDDAVRVTDREAVEMSRYLMREDGLFVGSSSSVNCVAAYRVAKRLGPGHRIVTVLCDSGSRHLTKFW
ncbi:tryptophan synthase beta subunit-like PLP-dependent enzyme, partial [Polychytrium aggregatum]|uniref:tryptophan synthase beta subunit-like PLP-dependent enzyme n=1 Tax=Polychytrium aggregatum TaxID=110093 RepID=UPI0022FEAC12